MAGGTASAIRAELARARGGDQVHGAYLFHGPPGTGKRETALWWARLLLCKRPGEEPCEQCGGCLRSGAGGEMGRSHPDLWLLEPDGAALKVEQVRELQRRLSLVANEGGRRVGVLFGVERMLEKTVSTLLKTLEEPPEDATLVLVAISADALPPTIRSRTTRYRFAAEPEAQVEAALLDAGLEPDDAWLAAALGGGSDAAAREWADEHLEAARALRDALRTGERGSASDALEFAEAFRGRGERIRSRCELFLAVHGALARRHIAAAAEAGDTAALEQWLSRAERGAHARRELAIRNLNPQLVVEGLMLDLRG